MTSVLQKTDYVEILLSIMVIGIVTLVACHGEPSDLARLDSLCQVSHMAGYNLAEDRNKEKRLTVKS